MLSRDTEMLTPKKITFSTLYILIDEWKSFILIPRPGIEPTPVARPMWLKKVWQQAGLNLRPFGCASHYATDITNTSYEISL